MKTLKFAILLVVISSAFSFAQKRNKKKDTIVVISTSLGDIKLKLYDETPIHRDNFIKLIQNKTLDSTLFHRVIAQFMIQGGDPESKRALPGTMLGNGEIGYTLPAEFNSSLYHKRGALAAARQGDNVNPNKESSACQFYIVHGRTFTNEELDKFEQRFNLQKKQQLFGPLISRPENADLKERLTRYQQNNIQDSLKILVLEIEQMIDKEIGTAIFKYSEQQRKDYITVGGAPHLDGNYTVFGEVIEGLDVVDKIANAPKDGTDRPLTDIRMKVFLK